MKPIYSLLKEKFGYDSFRDGQEELIEHILNHSDVLGVMPTGSGKSLCFQLPTLLMDGITIVISPLISLMQDQTTALLQSGIKAAYLNSSLTPKQQETMLETASAGEYDLIYIAPERLGSTDFLDFIHKANIAMIAVDEAHCISQWGHHFRPDYMQIRPFIDSFEVRPVISAFTATATLEVRNDIIFSLGLQNPFVTVKGYDRKNLYFEVLRPFNKMAALDSIIASHKDASGIIYCGTRKTVEKVHDHLVRKGLPATRYHAGLSDKERVENQNDFIFDRKPIIAATNAFGMGIDKSNVSYIVHFNMPMSVESYYQEAGRAGRDGTPAICVMLYSPQDVQLDQYLIDVSIETGANMTDEMRTVQKAHAMAQLRSMIHYATTSDCLRHTILKYFGENPGDFCGHCSNCDTVFEQVDVTQEAKKIISCVYRIHERGKAYGKTTITEVLRGEKSDRVEKYKLETLSTYGIMADTSAEQINQVINWLIDRGFLEKSTENLVITLLPTYKKVLESEEPILAKFPKGKVSATMKPAQKKTASFSYDERMFDQLRKLRKKIADEQGVPPYIVFSDAALQSMAAVKPVSRQQFMSVKGVGQEKLNLYADRFIEVVKNNMNEQS